MSRYALDLPGCEEKSIWGYDDPTGVLFAQIWSNGSRAEDPEAWVQKRVHTYESVRAFLEEVAAAIGFSLTPDEVLLVMATDGVTDRAQLLLATRLAEHADLAFLKRAHATQVSWVVYEVENNFHYSVATLELDQLKRRSRFGWLRFWKKN